MRIETDMKLIRNRHGTTLIEMIIAVTLLSFVLICTLSMMGSALRMWAMGASGTGANSYSCLAARKLVLDIEEGKSASVVYDGNGLQVVFPYYNPSTGDYDRTAAGVTATYYLSGSTGAESSGTYLWKSAGGNKTRLAKNVQSTTFTVTNGNLIRFAITGIDQAGGAVSPNLVQQSIKLRNG